MFGASCISWRELSRAWEAVSQHPWCLPTRSQLRSLSKNVSDVAKGQRTPASQPEAPEQVGAGDSRASPHLTRASSPSWACSASTAWGSWGSTLRSGSLPASVPSWPGKRRPAYWGILRPVPLLETVAVSWQSPQFRELTEAPFSLCSVGFVKGPARGTAQLTLPDSLYLVDSYTSHERQIPCLLPQEAFP